MVHYVKNSQKLLTAQVHGSGCHSAQGPCSPGQNRTVLGDEVIDIPNDSGWQQGDIHYNVEGKSSMPATMYKGMNKLVKLRGTTSRRKATSQWQELTIDGDSGKQRLHAVAELTAGLQSWLQTSPGRTLSEECSAGKAC
eukprot:764588-Hanusia_phi.AAC.4